jgi:alpha-amylase
MDVNTENPYVVETLNSYIANFTKTYQVDGLRIDGQSFPAPALSIYSPDLWSLAAKHVPGAFWTGFCSAADVFCIGEVYGSDMG